MSVYTLKLFFYLLFLAGLGLCCCDRFSVVSASKGYFLVSVCGLLIVEASLIVDHRL